MSAMFGPVLDEGGRDPGARPRGQVFSTRSVPTHESLEFWHDAVLATLVGMDIRAPGRTYDATMRTERLGAVQMTTVSCDPGTVVRSPRLIAAGDVSQVLVAVQASGVAQVEQDGRTTELRAGDIGFFETARPFRTRFPQRFRMDIFALPREALGRSEAELLSLTARAVRPTRRLPALLSPFLSKLAEGGTRSGGGPVGERLAGTVVDLLAATAAEQLGLPLREQAGAKRALLLQVQRFIRWHLADPGLTPQVVARAHGISVRYLHRLFEEEDTTVSSWIRALRVAEVRRDLAAAAPGQADVGRLARRWGFSGTGQLARAFRACHGVSPTDWSRRNRKQEELWASPN